MAESPKDGFPVFQDGDVEVCLSRKPEDRFVLHSFVLGLHSPFFKASISERWSRGDDDATSGALIKWRYQLLFEEGMDDDPILAKAVCRLHCLSQFSRLRSKQEARSIFCVRLLGLVTRHSINISYPSSLRPFR